MPTPPPPARGTNGHGVSGREPSPAGTLQWPHRTCRPRDLLSVSWTSGLTHDSHPRQQSQSRVPPPAHPQGRAGEALDSRTAPCRLQAWLLGAWTQHLRRRRHTPSCQHGVPGLSPCRPPEPEKRRGAGTPTSPSTPTPSLPRADSPPQTHAVSGATPHHRPLGSPEQRRPVGIGAGPRCPGLSRTHPGGEPEAQRGTTGSPRQHLRRAPMPTRPESAQGPTGAHGALSSPGPHWGPQQRWKGSQGPRPSRSGRAREPPSLKRGSSSGPALVRTAPSRAQPASPRCPDVSSGRRPPPPAAAPGGLPTRPRSPQVPSLTTWHRRTATAGHDSGPSAPGQTGGEPARSGPWSPLEAHSPDWPQAHTLALTPKRPAAQLRCPTSLDPDGASAASPQQGGGPTSPAADLRGAHRCKGVPCKAGGRKQSPWVEALQPANPKGGLQDRGLSAPLAEGRAGVGGIRAAASSHGR